MGLAKFFKAKCEKLLKLQLRKKKHEQEYYERVDPTSSMRVEASSKLAQKIIAETLKAADSPGNMKALDVV